MADQNSNRKPAPDRDPKIKATNTAPPAPRTETANVDLSFLGSLPLLPGEDPAAYERLRAALVAEMQPADVMEQIWTNDMTYTEWEILRFRRVKANFMVNLAAGDAMMARLSDFAGEDPHANVASLIAANIQILEPLDAMIAKLELRRNNAYHEAEQHRANLGHRLRRAVEKVEEAEFRELKGRTIEDKRVA